jgi:hypothetical protein
MVNTFIAPDAAAHPGGEPAAVRAINTGSGTAVTAISFHAHAVRGICLDNVHAGICGIGELAALFMGNVMVVKGDVNIPTGNITLGMGNINMPTGNITLGTGDILLSDGSMNLANGDCAEQFDVAGGKQLEPGTVVVLDDEGRLRESSKAYDKKVAGVISGAGEFRPGIVLDRRASEQGRAPVALMGKVFCKIDAHCAPIQVGDLLTTSDVQGHAMKATEPGRAFGAVIGKALRSKRDGKGMIPILIALQ